MALKQDKVRSVIGLLALAAAFCAPPAQGEEWLKGTVELSTGEKISGEIQFVQDRLYIHNEAQNRRYMVSSNEIGVLETILEKESQERKWFFKEDGRDEKVYTGDKFPVRYYLTRITFHDGRTLQGHIIGKTIFVKSEGRRYRFTLRRKDEGEVGEKLADLPYVRRVVFEDGGDASVKGSITGTLQLPPGEKFKKILAINRRNDFILEGKVAQGGRVFRFSDCTGGIYDLVVVTNRALYLYFSREKDEGCARLHRGAVDEIQRWVDKLRDFFHEQTILYAAGNEKKMFALIRKERHGGTTLPGAELIRRYDVWVMNRPKQQWQIEKRLFVDRQVSGKKTVPREQIVVTPSLGNRALTAEKPLLKLRLKLERTGEVPIPSKAKGVPKGQTDV